jgi:cytochrome c556
MKRTFGLMVSATALMLVVGVTHADELTKTIMRECNGADGFAKATTNAVKAKDWAKANEAATGLKESTAKLAEGKPKKGSDESWKEQTKKFADYGAAVYDAVEKKDGKAATKALGAYGSSCKACHMVHK